MSGDTSRTAQRLTSTAVALTVLLGLLDAGYAVEYVSREHSLGTAIGTTAPWLVLVVALSVFAVWSRFAPPIFVLLTAFIGGRSIADHAAGLVDRDEVGPLAAISVLVLTVALGFLGLRRPLLAGVLMMTLGVLQLVAVLVGTGVTADGGVAELLITSTGVVVVPLLVLGALFVVAGRLGHDRFRHPAQPPAARPREGTGLP